MTCSPYDQAVKELSQFAFLTLQKDLISALTEVEVKAACPTLITTNWCGLGL